MYSQNPLRFHRDSARFIDENVKRWIACSEGLKFFNIFQEYVERLADRFGGEREARQGAAGRRGSFSTANR